MGGKIAQIRGLEINPCSVIVLRGFKLFKEGEEHPLGHLKRERRERRVRRERSIP